MKKIKFVDKSVYLENERILVIGDLHFGFEEELNKAGILIPRNMMKEVLESLSFIKKRINSVKKVILLGDVKESFGKILKQEKEELFLFLKKINEYFSPDEIIIIKGNHDVLLDLLLKKENFENLKIKNFHLEKDILFFHGDYKSFNKLKKEVKKIKMIVVGHFHPAINLTDGEKIEKFKCFVKGKLDGKEILIVPSFFPLIEGADILGECELNLIPIKEKKIFVVSPDGEVYDFGKIK